MRRTKQRKAMVGGFAAALIATMAGSAVAASSGPSGPGDVNTKKFRDAVTVNQILQHERQFQRIANRNDGTRASGTPGYKASVRYVSKTLRRAGYKVRIQEFTFPFSRDLEPAEFSELSPTAQDFETAAFSYSGSGDVTGQIVPTNDVVIPAAPEPGSTSGCEASDFPTAPAAPAIALIQRGTCSFEIKADNAAAAGYDAAIIFNEGNPGRTDLTIGTLGAPKSIPVIGLSYDDAVALYEESQSGPVTGRVFTSTESDLNRKTYNVIADSPRGKKKGETVVVGAHLDSVAEGPGINDNGSGAATTLEIAEQMATKKYTKKLQRRIRFAFWGAEESGLLGAQHYVDNLNTRQLNRIYANLNFDMVGSPNYVRFVYDGDGSDTPDAGPPGSAEIETVFTDYFESQDLATAPTAFDGRSDYGPFIEVGIPSGGLFSGAEGIKTEVEAAVFGGAAGEPYDACYHSACDTITNLSTKALNELGDGAAHAVLTLALSKRGLYPDSSFAKTTPKRTRSYDDLQKGHTPLK
ncbi:MAG: M28 family metallopeptidase [Nocardioides sp.]|nr:M28 family metallopeptidase [Nocardioides sp.]